MGETNEELLWKRYQLGIDLYKHYFDLLVKSNAFYYAVTAGVVTLYFSSNSPKTVKYCLLFPISMSLILALFYLYGAGMVHTLQKELSTIAGDLRLRAFVDVRFLRYSLEISGLLCCLVAIGLLVLMVVR